MKAKYIFREVAGITMTQPDNNQKYIHVSMKEGINRYGGGALEAILSEYAQLDDETMCEQQDHHKLPS